MEIIHQLMWRYQETQIPKNILPRWGLGKLLPLLTGIGLPSVKDVLIPSRFTAASSVLDVSTKKIFRSSYNQIETSKMDSGVWYIDEGNK